MGRGTFRKRPRTSPPEPSGVERGGTQGKCGVWIRPSDYGDRNIIGRWVQGSSASSCDSASTGGDRVVGEMGLMYAMSSVALNFFTRESSCTHTS